MLLRYHRHRLRALSAVFGLLAAVGCRAQLAPPANDDRAAAQSLVTGRYAAVDLRLATVEPNELIPPDYTPDTWSNSAWFTWTAPEVGGWHQIVSSALSAGLWKVIDGTAPEPVHSFRFTPGSESFVFRSDPAATYLIGITSEQTKYAHCASIKVVPRSVPPWSVLQAVISPSTVDVSASEQSVDVVFTVSKGHPLDPEAFIAALLPPAARRPLFEFGPMAEPDGPVVEVSSTEASRTFRQRLKIPAKAMPGAWRLQIASALYYDSISYGAFGQSPLTGAASGSLTVVAAESVSDLRG